MRITVIKIDHLSVEESCGPFIFLRNYKIIMNNISKYAMFHGSSVSHNGSLKPLTLRFYGHFRIILCTLLIVCFSGVN